MDPTWRTTVGPYTASDIRPGDPYELSNGQLIECMGTGQRGARTNASGAMLLGTDPDVRSVGVDAGISPRPDILRAPDIVIGDLEDKPGWAPKSPPLAVEYADTGQDEPQLRQKIAELLATGTQLIWVVRLHGPRCVEVHAPSAPVWLARIGDVLAAPGILRNPVPVSALYDLNEAQRLTLRNLLQREGYDSIQAIKTEGFDEGFDEGRDEGALIATRNALYRILTRRSLSLSSDDTIRIDQCTDRQTLERWLDAAIDAATTRDVFA